MSNYAELIQVKKGLYGAGQINRNASPDHVCALLSSITEDCKMLGDVAKSLDEAGGLDKFLQNCQEDVVRSYLGSDLLQLYKGVYFSKGLGYEKMLENLTSILKVPSTEQLTKQARVEFNQVTRRTDIDESFTEFLARLNSEVAKFCNQTPYSTTLVEEQFKGSLRDIDKTFLLMLTHDKTGAQKLAHEAKMLDSKNLHKRHVQEVTAINAVSQAEASVAALADSVTEFIRNESDLRRREAEAREQRDQKRWAEMESKIETLARANFYSQPHVMNHAQMVPQAQIPQQAYMIQSKQMTQNPFQTQNVHNIAKTTDPTRSTFRRRPVKEFCFECGSRWHETKDCKGDFKGTCWLCGVKGHTALAKKFHGPNAEKN